MTCPIEDRYWALKRLADRLGGLPVPSFYYGVIQFSNESAKAYLITAAKRLGLQDLTGEGTYRFMHKWGRKDFQQTEVYLHTRGDPLRYGITNPVVSLDVYQGSSTQPTTLLKGQSDMPIVRPTKLVKMVLFRLLLNVLFWTILLSVPVAFVIWKFSPAFRK